MVSFLLDGLAEPSVFPSVISCSCYLLFHQVHMQVHHLWFVFHKKIPSSFSLQHEAFLDARCHTVFYENDYINRISWKLTVPLLSQYEAALLLLANKNSYLSIIFFMMKFESSNTEIEVASLLWEGQIACSCFLTVWSCVIYLQPAALDEFSMRNGIGKVTPTFGMVSSSWSIVLIHCSTLDASLQHSHI